MLRSLFEATSHGSLGSEITLSGVVTGWQRRTRNTARHRRHGEARTTFAHPGLSRRNETRRVDVTVWLR